MILKRMDELDGFDHPDNPKGFPEKDTFPENRILPVRKVICEVVI